MARRRKTHKRAVKRGSTVKTQLGHVIKSLQSIKKHVDGVPIKQASTKRAKRGPAKTLRSPTLPPWSEKEPMTLDSPTLRRPGATSAAVTLRSPTYANPWETYDTRGR